MLTLHDVIYMIVTDRFCDADHDNNLSVTPDTPHARHGGDLMGIVQRMPYLRDLGVSVLWITPVYLNPPESYHGYHPLDFDSVDPHLCSPTLGPAGSREAIARFVQIAHEHGFKVMLDIIVSHTSKDHAWLKERPQWIDWHGCGVEKEWFKGLPNINHDNLDVNVYFLHNVLRWISETQADAVRIDAARHVESQFWRLFKLYINGVLPFVTVVGEFWDCDPHYVAPYQNLHGFHGMFDFPLFHAVRDVFIGDHPFARIARPRLSTNEPDGILDLDPVYRSAYQLITFLGNHDTTRFFEAAGGNDDPATALARMKLALILLMTGRGVPQLYYGDELAMPGGEDPDNRRDMPWTLLHGKPDTPEKRRARDMHDFTRRLIALRRSCAALCYGLWAPLYVTDRLLVFARFVVEEFVVVALNNSDTPATVSVPLALNPHIPELVRNRLADGMHLVDRLGTSDALLTRFGCFELNLPARTGTVFSTPLDIGVEKALRPAWWDAERSQ